MIWDSKRIKWPSKINLGNYRVRAVGQWIMENISEKENKKVIIKSRLQLKSSVINLWPSFENFYRDDAAKWNGIFVHN